MSIGQLTHSGFPISVGSLMNRKKTLLFPTKELSYEIE